MSGLRKQVIQEIYSITKQSQEITTTYSAVMRDLRKKDPKKVATFMKAFKEAFDAANEDNLDDVESVALLQALQSI